MDRVDNVSKEPPKINSEELGSHSSNSELVTNGIARRFFERQPAQNASGLALMRMEGSRIERTLTNSYLSQEEIAQLNRNSPILLEIDTAANATGHISATLNLAAQLVKYGYTGGFHLSSTDVGMGDPLERAQASRENAEKLEAEIKRYPSLNGKVSKGIPSALRIAQYSVQETPYQYTCVISGAMDARAHLTQRDYANNAVVIQMQPPSFKEDGEATLTIGETRRAIDLNTACVKNPDAVLAQKDPNHEIVLYNIKAFSGMSAGKFLQALDASLPAGKFTINSYGIDPYKIKGEDVDLKALNLKKIVAFNDRGKVDQKQFAETVSKSALVVCEGANTANLCSQIGTPYIHINKGGTKGYYPGKGVQNLKEYIETEGSKLRNGETANLAQVMDHREQFIQNAADQAEQPDTFLSLLSQGLKVQRKMDAT